MGRSSMIHQHGPRLLFLDEPTIGLDITAKAAIRDFIREQSREAGLTVLLTSHDTRDIELVCERVIVFNAGRIVVSSMAWPGSAGLAHGAGC